MKLRVLTLTLSVLLMLALAACGGAAEEPTAVPEPSGETSAAVEPTEAPPEPTEAPPEPTEEPVAVEPQEATIAVGTFVLNVGYPWLTMPMDDAVGFWQELGVDVTVEPVGASLDALQQLVAGNVDFIQGNSTVVLQANVQEGIPVRVVHETGLIDWGLAVPADSDITEVSDFAGRKIGVFSLASGGIPLMKAYLSANGVDPDSDIEMIPVGFGPQASEALNNGDVDAVMLWNSALVQLQNLGHDFRIFRHEEWKQMPDFVLATTQEVFDERREMVVNVVKGINMASVFTVANPDCVVSLQWKALPDTKPADISDEEAKQWDLNILAGQVDEALIPAYELHGSDLWGVATAEEYGKLQDFLIEQELLDEAIDPTNFFIDDPTFWEEVNDFDPQPIIELAEACDFD